MKSKPPAWMATAWLAALAACGGGGGDAGSPSAPAQPAALPAPATQSQSPLLLTALPLGDGKITTTAPQVGFILVCSVPASANPVGKAPWINSDGVTWNATAKIAVQGAVAWNSTLSEAVSNGTLSLTGNGLPNHFTGIFPIGASDPAYAYDKNPNAIRSVSIAYGVPSNPVVSATPTCTGLGPIGVLLTGARLFNGLDADGRDAVAHEVQDSCNGHPQATGSYHYHNVSSCVAQADTVGAHSPLVGYIADGFGLYGNLGVDGKALTNADLDECHGHSHALPINGKTVTQYHYHATKEYPYTVGCFRGQPAVLR